MNSCVCSTARFRNNDGRPVVRAPNVFGDHFWRVSASQIRVKIPDCGRLGFGLSFEPLETREAFEENPALQGGIPVAYDLIDERRHARVDRPRRVGPWNDELRKLPCHLALTLVEGGLGWWRVQ